MALLVAAMVDFGFELDRRLVARRRVEAQGVADGIDEPADVAAGSGECLGKLAFPRGVRVAVDVDPYSFL